jgi:hypothetical protein
MFWCVCFFLWGGLTPPPPPQRCKNLDSQCMLFLPLSRFSSHLFRIASYDKCNHSPVEAKVLVAVTRYCVCLCLLISTSVYYNVKES